MHTAIEHSSLANHTTLAHQNSVGTPLPVFLDGFDDLSIARRYAAESIALLRRSGFTVAMEFDLSDWAQIMETAENSILTNPAFDPAHSRLDASNSFWLRISDKHGTCAVIADKLVVCDDYLEELRSCRMYYADPTETQRIELAQDLPFGRFSGRIGCAGGLWVHPRARKQGLSWLLPRLVRSYSVQFWGVDRHCAVVVESTRSSGLVEQAYGFQDVHLLTTGYFPPAEKPVTVYVIHISRDEILEQFSVDLEAIAQDRDQKVRDVATIVGKRKDQAAIG